MSANESTTAQTALVPAGDNALDAGTTAETPKKGRWRRRIAGALSMLTPGVLTFGVGVATGSLPVTLIALGATAGLHRLWRRGYERALGVYERQEPRRRPIRDVLERLTAASVTSLSPVVGIALLRSLGLPDVYQVVLALGSLLALPVPIFEATRRLLGAAGNEVLGAAPEPAALLSAADTRLVGHSVQVGDPVAAPLSNRPCLAASVVAVDRDDGELGRVDAATELGLEVGDNLFVVCGEVRVGGDDCDYAMPARGARVRGAAASLVEQFPAAELREYLVREGDRIEVAGPELSVESHRAFNDDYRRLGEGRVLRGTAARPVVVHPRGK